MTATPIPRTIAAILYGDLDISQIRTMPKGRKGIHTYKCSQGERNRVLNFVEKERRQEGKYMLLHLSLRILKA